MSDQFEGFAPAQVGFSGSFEGAAGFASSVWAPGGLSSDGRSLATNQNIYGDKELAFNTSTLYKDPSDALFADTLPAAGHDTTHTTIDTSKTVQQQIESGAFKQSDAQPPQHTEVKDGEQPKITVSKDTNSPYDFKVKADGTVEVTGNPEAGNKPLSEYKIAVEEGADQKQTDALVNYLRDRIAQKGGDFQPTLDAVPGLISDGVRDAFKKRHNDDDQTDDTNGGDNGGDGGCDNGGGGGGCDGGGGGGGGGGGDDTNLDTDDGKNKHNDGDKPDGGNDSNRPSPSAIEAMRNAMVTSTDSGGRPNYDNPVANSLGAYSMNVGNWCVSILTPEMLEELGNPPDWSKLGKIMKKHANDPKFKAKIDGELANLKDQGDEQSAKTLDSLFNKLSTDEQFANGFGQFLADQQAGRNATPDQMKSFFGKDVQDALQSSQMSDMASQMHIKLKDMNEKQSGDLALSMLVGHSVTSEEKQRLLKENMYSSYVQNVEDSFKKARGGK